MDADANADKGDELDRQAVGKKVKLQIWDTAGQVRTQSQLANALSSSTFNLWAIVTGDL